MHVWPLALALLVPPLAVTACGGGGDGADRPAAASGSEVRGLPFPPRAQEPARSPAAAGEPQGRVVAVGDGPEGVAVVGGVAGVALENGGIALVDVAAGRAGRRVPLPSGARHVQAGGGRFLVPLEDADTLAEVPLEGQPRLTRVGDNPHDAAMLDDGTVVVGDEFGSTATFVRGGRVVREVPVDVQPGGVASLGDRAALVSVRANTIQLLDRRGRRPEGSQNAGYGPSHAVADADGRVYITDTRGDQVLVFQTRPRVKAVGRVALAGSPYGIAIDRRRGRVWVTTVGNNTLHELTLGDQPRAVGTRPTIRQANTLGVDEETGRLVLASRTDGAVQLIDP
jgi:DNA-binding beta-propeller fold protein YncE